MEDPMPMPAKPPIFDPEHAPVGCEVRFYSRWQSREKIVARLILVHTNAARGEGTLDSASNWAERNVTAAPGEYYTIPHYQVDRDGRARKILPSNRRGIANSTGDWVQDNHGDAATFSLAIETADTGTDDDPSISDFTPDQAETVATI